MTTRLHKLIFGFTLVELLVAVLVISILAAIAIPTFLGQRNRAYDTEAISALKNTQTAIMTVLAGELEMPRPVEALVAALEEIEPVYTLFRPERGADRRRRSDALWRVGVRVEPRGHRGGQRPGLDRRPAGQEAFSHSD